MKVLHVIPSVSPRYGGPAAAVRTMAAALREQGVDVVVATIETEEPGAELATSAGVVRKVDEVEYHSFKRDAVRYNVSWGLFRWLREHVSEFDVLHIHALFTWSSTVAAREAQRQGVPYIVRPLGVLNRWGMENRRRFLKRVSFAMVEGKILRAAACIHYTAEAERAEAALLGESVTTHRSVVIPVPVAPREPGDPALLRAKFPMLERGPVVLFLSRIDRKKGLELLLDAFDEVRRSHPTAVLLIAGNGEPRYVAELRERATATGNNSQVVWAGHLDGALKASAFACASVFVLPSLSENFGIAAAESLAAAVPTILTREVALSAEVERGDAGIVVQRTPAELAGAIEVALSGSAAVQQMAERGRQLVRERYAPAAVARALRELYGDVAEQRHERSR